LVFLYKERKRKKREEGNPSPPNKSEFFVKRMRVPARKQEFAKRETFPSGVQWVCLTKDPGVPDKRYDGPG